MVDCDQNYVCDRPYGLEKQDVCKQRIREGKCPRFKTPEEYDKKMSLKET